MNRSMMNHSKLKIVLLAGSVLIAIAVISAAGGYWLAQHDQSTGDRPDASNTDTAIHKNKPKILYWYDPMAPNQHFDKPGKSPFMDMPLIVKYADSENDEKTGNGRADNPANNGSIKISEALTQSLGIRYATAAQGVLNTTLQMPANVMFNERDIAIVQTKSSGFVESVYARAPGDIVTAGTPLLKILVPEWAAAQAEYLALKKSGDMELTRAAQERLRFLGMPENSIRQLAESGKVQNLYTVVAPISGVIQALDVRQGMTVSSGMTIARINGLATVWLEAAVPEMQAAHLKAGKKVSAVLTAYPDVIFNGRIHAILPEADLATRTLRVRMEFPNPKLRLRPGMFARIQLDAGASEKVLLIPAEAVIRTGKRNVVIVAEKDGYFRPLEVALGAESDGNTVILSGLKAGQKVVASGQFLIDSEASLKGVMARMNEAEDNPAPETVAETGIYVRGVIEDIGKNEITISHDAIPELAWPAMTMAFPTISTVDSSVFKVGQKIRFTLKKTGKDPVITYIQAVIKTGERL